MTFKALYGLGPIYLLDCLSWYASRRALCWRYQNFLAVSTSRHIRQSSTRTRVFFALSLAWWNILPDNTQVLRDLSLFFRAWKENCSIRHLVEGSNGFIVWHFPDCLFPPSPPTIDLVGARYYAIILLLFLDLILTLIELYNLYVVCHFEPGFSRKSCLKIKLIC